jgi:YD repeat-containing protein
MATKKSKTETKGAVFEMPGTIGSAKLVFPEKSVTVKGNHLTVTTHPDGRTDLVWDDDALLKEVQDAIASVKTKGETNGKTKKASKSK